MPNIFKNFALNIDSSFENLCSSINEFSPLEPKTNELIKLASVVTNRSENGVQIHVMKAFSNGATRREIIATIFNCLPVTGIEAITSALIRANKILLELEEEQC